MECDISSHMVDPLEPVQEREEVTTRVVDTPATGAAGGEELLAEPAEVGDPIPRGLFRKGLRVEGLGARPGTATGAHQGQRVDSFPGQDLGMTARG